jgi:SSS family solute:Na+ symporter
MSVLLIACCYWKRANSWGALGAILGGALMPILFLTLEKMSSTASWAAAFGKDNAGIAAFAAAAIGMIAGSLMKPRNPEPPIS